MCPKPYPTWIDSRWNNAMNSPRIFIKQYLIYFLKFHVCLFNHWRHQRERLKLSFLVQAPSSFLSRVALLIIFQTLSRLLVLGRITHMSVTISWSIFCFPLGGWCGKTSVQPYVGKGTVGCFSFSSSSPPSLPRHYVWCLDALKYPSLWSLILNGL